MRQHVGRVLVARRIDCNGLEDRARRRVCDCFGILHAACAEARVAAIQRVVDLRGTRRGGKRRGCALCRRRRCALVAARYAHDHVVARAADHECIEVEAAKQHRSVHRFRIRDDARIADLEREADRAALERHVLHVCREPVRRHGDDVQRADLADYALQDELLWKEPQP